MTDQGIWLDVHDTLLHPFLCRVQNACRLTVITRKLCYRRENRAMQLYIKLNFDTNRNEPEKNVVAAKSICVSSAV